MAEPAGVAATAGGAAGPVAPRPRPGRVRSTVGSHPWAAAYFLLPALVLLGALVAYPIGWSVVSFS